MKDLEIVVSNGAWQRSKKKWKKTKKEKKKKKKEKKSGHMNI
jgi:hypothetical protein